MLSRSNDYAANAASVRTFVVGKWVVKHQVIRPGLTQWRNSCSTWGQPCSITYDSTES
jgi:hypothetical protein